jgi:hypothetical protein
VDGKQYKMYHVVSELVCQRSPFPLKGIEYIMLGIGMDHRLSACKIQRKHNIDCETKGRCFMSRDLPLSKVKKTHFGIKEQYKKAQTFAKPLRGKLGFFAVGL